MEILKDKMIKIKNYLMHRQQSYQLTFKKDDLAAKAVLADLAKFCRANETAFNPDQRIHAVLEGRREVWLRIINHLNLSSQELWELYSKKD